MCELCSWSSVLNRVYLWYFIRFFFSLRREFIMQLSFNLGEAIMQCVYSICIVYTSFTNLVY
jgi:hypothetical protein